jgi:hypothetical protein
MLSQDAAIEIRDKFLTDAYAALTKEDERLTAPSFILEASADDRTDTLIWVSRMQRALLAGIMGEILTSTRGKLMRTILVNVTQAQDLCASLELVKDRANGIERPKAEDSDEESECDCAFCQLRKVIEALSPTSDDTEDSPETL